MNEFTEQVRILLSIYSIEDLFEILGITEEQVLIILLEEGHVSLREIPFMDNTDDTEVVSDG